MAMRQTIAPAQAPGIGAPATCPLKAGWEAKARAMASAGYPADAGGLLPSLTPGWDTARKGAGQ
ncbi:hypothetical protein [Xanthobacter autotrophicus]|uniref:hypothetical protein n=1 Tax=Xanthobacter autotrophicus TaxID=280 RepID=UPI0037268C41